MGGLGQLRQELNRRRAALAALVTALGFLSGALGILMGVAAATPVSAAPTLVITGCTGAVTILVPGDSGSCNVTFNLSGHGNPGNVYLSATTTSTSAGAGVGTEALLDGLPTGLQVTLTDATSGNAYRIGAVSCTGTYPSASSCSSGDSLQPVSASSITATPTDVVTVSWNFPRQAGNLYQGASATVNLQEEYSGTTVQPNNVSKPGGSGAVLGQHTTKPGGSQGTLGASTPTTGAQLPIAISRVLIVFGLLLVFGGLWVWRRPRYFVRR
ncbi:MAG: hypothetical protein ACYCYK_11765 [Candidatus Dormibacteria bacterium]